MRFVIVFFLSSFWLGLSGQADDPKYPTTLPLRAGDLKNGYQLLKLTDENFITLRLIGPGIDTLLNQITSKQESFELGTLIADVDSFFIMKYPYTDMKIYAKHNGHVIAKGRFIEKDVASDIIYFVDAKKPDFLTLYDLKKKRLEWYESPYDASSTAFMRIGNKQIGDNYLVVWYILPDNTLKKKYYARQ